MDVHIPLHERGDGGFVRTKDGFRLEPALEMIEPEDITKGLFDRALDLVGIDPDDVIAGKEIELPKHPPSLRWQPFFDTVVVNAKVYKPLDEMQWSLANTLCATVVQDFIDASAE